ncbi:MAG: hypothetical protein AB2806_00885 [Candidatus Thiodiazotropha sp.]
MKSKWIIVALCSVVLCSCLDTMTEQDHAFVNKIKQHLKKKGDVVKVSDIHPGDWVKVCSTGYGTYGDALNVVSEFSGIRKDLLEVKDSGNKDTTYTDELDWGIYFYYPPNKVEYFSIYRDEILPNSINAIKDDYSCVTKNRAYFIAMSNRDKKGKRDDFIFMQLSEKNNGDE